MRGRGTSVRGSVGGRSAGRTVFAVLVMLVAAGCADATSPSGAPTSEATSDALPSQAGPPAPTGPAFTSDPSVGPIAVQGLRIISAGFPFYAAGYVLTQSFNGAGDTVTPTLINVLCLWMGEIPIAYVLARPAGLGPAGVFWSIAIAFSIMSLVSAAVFRRGRWKLKRV